MSERAAAPSRAPSPSRQDYAWFVPLTTRWMDNDVYGHVNNVVYYAFFDTVINRYLIEEGGLDIHEGSVIGLAVETACTFAGSIRFPDPIEAGRPIPPFVVAAGEPNHVA